MTVGRSRNDAKIKTANSNSKPKTEKMEVHHHPKESLQLPVGSLQTIKC
jgi:hypothetical protein